MKSRNRGTEEMEQSARIRGLLLKLSTCNSSREPVKKTL